MKPKQSGFGIASLVIGILGIVLVCFGIGGFLGVVGIILAIIAFVQKDRGHGTAIGGLVCSFVAIALFVIASVYNYMEDNQDQVRKVSESEQEQQTEEYTDSSDDYFTLGDSIQTDNFIITFSAASLISDEVAYQEPDEGYAFMKSDFEFENISDEDQDVYGYNFTAYSDDYSVDYINSTLDATLSPGKKTKGSVYFEVPVDTNIFEIEYNTSYLGSSKIKFAVKAEE